MTGYGGLKIGLKQLSPLLDTVFGLKDGSVRQQTNADLSIQLMSSGPLANLLATTSGNVVFFATKEIMDAATDYTAPQAAWVFADDDPGNNGAYYFTNGDPGFWTFMLNFPNSWVYATVSGGDANAIELSMPATASQSTMIFFEVQDDNFAGGVTIAINGGDPLSALDFRGDALEAGALAEGALAVFFPLGDGTARMIIDNTATAAAAAAAASAASANTSALASSDSAVAAAASATSAQRFATAPEDEETSVGSGLFSAFHWAQKAMAVVLGDIADQITAATAATPGASDIFAFVENATGNLKKITLTNLIAAFKSTGDMATKSGAETLANKTLSDPVITGHLPQTITALTAAVAANALTISLPKCALDFRSTTLADGTPSRVEVTSTQTLTVPSGATLGCVSGQAARLAILAIDNAGAVEVAVANLRGGVNLDETNLISTIAISGTSNSAAAIYSTSARSNVPFRVVGFIDVTETVAGTWATAPTKVQGAGGQAASGMASLGFGQSWQSVTRASGVTYYNNTGKPIELMTYINSGSSNSASAAVTMRGVTTTYVGGFASGGTVCVGSILIPAGEEYIPVFSNASSLTNWELR